MKSPSTVLAERVIMWVEKTHIVAHIGQRAHYLKQYRNKHKELQTPKMRAKIWRAFLASERVKREPVRIQLARLKDAESQPSQWSTEIDWSQI